MLTMRRLVMILCEPIRFNIVISVNLGFQTLKQNLVFARQLHFSIRYSLLKCATLIIRQHIEESCNETAQRVSSAYSFIKFQFEHFDLLWDWFVVKSWKKRLQR